MVDVAHRIAQDRGQRPAKLFLLEDVAAGTVREPDHIDLRHGKELVRAVVEEQQANVLGKRSLHWAADNVHSTS